MCDRRGRRIGRPVDADAVRLGAGKRPGLLGSVPHGRERLLQCEDGGAGTIPSGGQTGFQWAAGDYVLSSILTVPTTSVTDLTANWSFVNELGGGGNNETWYVYLNGVAVAQTTLPDCDYCGTTQTVTGTVNFAGIAPIGGGYQLELVLQNTIPFGGGSVAWLDGGTTGLSYSAVPEPSTWAMMLLGFAGLGFAGYRGAKRAPLSAT